MAALTSKPRDTSVINTWTSRAVRLAAKRGAHVYRFAAALLIDLSAEGE
jgi:hypothetical protein